MKANMGTIDRIMRILLAISIGIAWYVGLISGVLAIVLGSIAVIFVLTSLVSFCPLYLPFGLSTLRKSISGHSKQ